MTSVFAISGPSGSGKTTLIEKLIPELNRRGLRVAAAKHDPHGHAASDVPGKDSWRLIQAGAEIVEILGPAQRASFAGRAESMELLAGLSREALACDVILVEGFKKGGLARIELVPPGCEPLLEPGTICIVGEHVAHSELPVFSRQDVEGIARFLVDRVKATAPALVVLSGGSSSRMGRDKATMILPGGQTMLETAIGQCRGLGRVIVVSRHEAHRLIADSAGADFVTDDGPQHPASGLIAALLAMEREAGLVALPCDIPEIRPGVLKRLAGAAKEQVDFACFAIRGRLHPLPGYFSRPTVDGLTSIAEDGRPLYELATEVPSLILSEHEARSLDPELRSFSSINSPEDLRRAGHETREAGQQEAC